MTRRTQAAALLISLVPALACGVDDGPDSDSAAAYTVPAPEAVPSPAAAASGEPNLVAAADGGVYLSWLEQTGPARHALRFARWDGDGWGEPLTVMDRENLFVNWADFPALTALEDGTLAAHWLEKSGPGTYSYDVRMALSRDGGRSWSEDIIPHRDGVEAEHGFVALHPVDGAVGLTWLDGRATVEGEPMTVRFTTVSAEGELGESVLLDASTCDCCQTALAVTDEGPIVAYRDRTEDEVRDISIVRRTDAGWSAPVTVHADGWVIPGCPVNGPSLAADGSRVAVAWFTGAPVDPEAGREGIRQAGEQGRVLAAFSDDGGATFGAPVRVDDGEAMGRVDLVMLEDGSALVAWLERQEGSAEVRVRHVAADGVGPATRVAGTAAQRASGFPHMALKDGRVFFAWTEPGDSAGVRTAVTMLENGGAE